MKNASLLFSICLLLSSLALSAGNVDHPYDLLLKAGNINVTENAGSVIDDPSVLKAGAFSGKSYYYVQFFNIPTSAEKNALENTGLKILDYIPNNTFIVEFPVDYEFRELKGRGIRAIFDIEPEYKQAVSLLDKDYPQWALRENERIELMVSLFTTVDMAAAAIHLTEAGTEILQQDDFSSLFILEAETGEIGDLASLPFVMFIEPIYPAPEPENYTGKTLHHSNVIDVEYAGGRNYDGAGSNVMLQDDGIVGPHIDFDSRIGEQYIGYNSGDHGDHIAGTILGAGNLDPTTKGMAPGASIFVYGAAPNYPGFELIPTHYFDPGIRITSTSYSNGCNAGYTSLARTMDLQVKLYPGLMHVFSAGNSGTQNCGYGAGPGWGNVTGGHKIGKNVIATANLDYRDNLSNSSSRGPAHDGRIKPDIAAKGSSVYSTTDPNDYTTKSGTSMACPGISGSIAQLYHAYKELNNDEEAEGGLIKGIILNTAEDLGNPGPDFLFGWGRINNLRAVMTLEEYRYLTDSIDQGFVNTHELVVPANAKEMRVMVYWTDHPANVGTNKALVNNIDIQITDPGNNVILPWVLNPYPHPDSLNKPAQRGIDDLNNMEQITIEDPAPGLYELTVSGTEIPVGPQRYYLTHEFVMDGIFVTYPHGGESFEPSESVVLRWDTWDDDNTFTIEFSPDEGMTWETVSDNLPGDQRYYNWTTPDEITGSGLIRIARDGISGVSEEPFSVMPAPEGIGFDYSCPNSVQISWDPLPGALSYEVYMLGDHYMELVGTTADDSLVVGNVSASETHWFSVASIGPDDAKSRRAIAVEKEPGIWNCVFGTDVSVSRLMAPPPGIIYDCQDYSGIQVQIKLTNSGLSNVTEIPVFYQFQGGNIVSEMYDGTIEPGESVVYAFVPPVSLPAPGDYEIKVWSEYQGDENLYNDTIRSQIDLKTAESVSMNVPEHFDDINTCSYFADCEETNCSMDQRWFNLVNLEDDDIDWRVLNGITPTQGTGPIGDHTTGTIDGNFLYLEASGECYLREAILMSPCIDLANIPNPALKFWYNMNGEDMGVLHLDVIHEGALTEDIMTPIFGDQGEDWLEATINLSSYAGSTINLRFRGITGDGELSDLAIDDVLITEATSLDEFTAGSGDLSIYPNPSDGRFEVHFSNQRVTERKFEIVDMFGRIVFSRVVTGNHFTADLSHLNEGIYFAIVKNDDEMLKRKILIRSTR